MGTPVNLPNNKMKLLLLLAAIGYTSAAVTCDECKSAAEGLVARLTTPESIVEQIQILIATVCPMAPNAADCELGISLRWPDMAGCLYPQFIGAGDVCERLGFCKVRSLQPKDWTCEECTDVMARVGDFMLEADTQADAVAYLQGECFCGAAGHTEECPSLVEQLLPAAMQVLAGVLVETTPELCQDVVGVC